MSQSQVSTEEFKSRKEAAEAETAAIEAEIGRDEAKKKLADQARGANETALDAKKAAKELADAEKARTDAEFAAVKAKIGAVPQSGIAGKVTIGTDAESLETALLAARATIAASQKIAKEVAPIVSAVSAAKLLVFAANELPDFKATVGFLAQRAIVLQALTDAASRSASVAEAESVTRRESPAVAGLALDAAAKILGFCNYSGTPGQTPAFGYSKRG